MSNPKVPSLQCMGLEMHKKRKLEKNSNRFEIESIDALQLKPGYFETCWQIPSELGTGTIKRFCFNNEIQLYIHNYKTLDTFSAEKKKNDPAFGFRFNFSGNTNLGIGYFKEDLRIRKDVNGFFYFPNAKISHENESGYHIYKALILIPPSSFLNMMEDGLNRNILAKIPQDDKESGKAPFNIPGTITPAMRIIMEQIIHCPYEGAVRRIFIEAKTMELMVCKLDQIRLGQSNPQKTTNLKTNDIDRMYYAGELLSKNMGAPPNIMELAKTIGVSRSKLYYDFNQFYGVSPMEYFRFKRIERAKLLVQNKELSLTQIAYNLGYASSSHFAKAFRENFGTSPSHYRQQAHCSKR